MAYSLRDVIEGNPFDAAQNAALGATGKYPAQPMPSDAPVGSQGAFPPAPAPSAQQAAPVDPTSQMSSGRPNPFNPGSLMWFMTGGMKAPTQGEYQFNLENNAKQSQMNKIGQARQQAFATLGKLMDQPGMTTQKAFLTFLNTPEGADFITKDPNPQEAIQQFMKVAAVDPIKAARQEAFGALGGDPMAAAAPGGMGGTPAGMGGTAPVSPVQTASLPNAQPPQVQGPVPPGGQPLNPPAAQTPAANPVAGANPNAVAMAGSRPNVAPAALDPQSYIKAAQKLSAAGDMEGAQRAIDLAKETLAFQQYNNPSPSDTEKNYNRTVAQDIAAGNVPKTLEQYQVELAQAGRNQNNINTVEGADAAQAKARITVDTKATEDAQKEAASARQGIALLGEAQRLQSSPAGIPGGWAGKAAPVLAQGMSALGMDVPENLSNAEALNTITRRLVSGVRQPGSTSDFEQRLYASAVPNLMQSNEGRQKIMDINKRLFQQQIDVYNVYRDNIGAKDLSEKLQSVYDKPMLTDADKKYLTDNGGSANPPAAGGNGAANNGPVTIKDAAGYNALQSGTTYIDPNGVQRMKK